MRGNGHTGPRRRAGRRAWSWLALTAAMALLAVTVGLGTQTAAEAAGQPLVRVEITHTDAAGQRMPVTQVEFALRNDYVARDGTGNTLVLPARGAANELIGYRAVLNPDGTVRLEKRDDSGNGQDQVLLDGAAVLRLVPQDAGKNDNLVDIKRWIKGERTNSNPYRNVMEFRRGTVTVTDAETKAPVTKTSLLAINELPVEDYLKGVLPSEMPASWPMEALKAQAVAARSFAVNHIRSLPEGGWIDDTTKYQKYDGYRVEHPRSNEAIQQTAGQVLTYNGRVITAWFSASNGGYTELAENVWSASVPYLQSVPDPYDMREGNSHRSWEVTYTKEQLQQRLENNRIQIGQLTALTPTKTSPSGRVVEMRFEGTQGSVTLAKNELRSVLGLKSLLFTLKSNGQLNVLSAAGQKPARVYGMKAVGANGAAATLNQSTVAVMDGTQETKTISTVAGGYTFVGQGYGHGVGMSQYGARFRAEDGHDYRQILAFYYPGTTLTANYNQ
ncbi:MAG: SpoIID/LytB domain-containing protein [Bacillota bacterium]